MKYVIIGGTGTLGNALMERLYPQHEVTIFSRDELKQQQMKGRYPNARYVIGDIRDKTSFNGAMKGADAVFHVAALKHVDVGEENPVEFIKTNILGTINVAEAAIDAGVRHFVFSSTDKAVLPINAYGMTKGISERYLLGLNKNQKATRFSVFRWGNVAGSRGSVIHAFARSLKEDGGVTITDPRMTRFWIHIEDAVDFMLKNYPDALLDRPMVPPMKAAKVTAIAEGLARIIGVKKYHVGFVGLRAGEKIHEVLESNHDFCLRSDTCPEFSKDELESLLRRVVC